MKKTLLSMLFFGLTLAQEPHAAGLSVQEMQAMMNSNVTEQTKEIEAENEKARKTEEASQKKQEALNKENESLTQRLQNVDSEEALQGIIKDIKKANKARDRAQRGSKYIDRNMEALYKALRKAVHDHKKAAIKVAKTAIEGFNDLPTVNYKEIKKGLKADAKKPLKQ